MALALQIANLASRATRLASTQGQSIRRVATTATAREDDGEGGFFDIFNGALKFGASLLSTVMGGLSFLAFSFSKLWGQVVGGALFLWNFNWNITDKQIDEQIKQAEIALASTKGSLAGQALGFTVCGLLPAATIAVFNEALALYIIKEVGEEAVEEIAGSLTSLISLQFKQVVRTSFFALFKNYRTLFRGAARSIAQGLVSVGQLDQKSVDKMEKKRNEPWSFSNAKDEQIEAISSPIDKAYWEEFWDEFQDSCIEAGFVVASSTDGFFALQKMATQAALGEEHIVEIQPIRSLDEAVTP